MQASNYRNVLIVDSRLHLEEDRRERKNFPKISSDF